MENDKLRNFLGKLTIIDKVLVLFLIIGTLLLVIGLFRGIKGGSQVQVEVIKNNEDVKGSSCWVDVGGAVMSPGVYEMPSSSRIKDVLVAAGGLSADADREYIQKNINLAEVIKDGKKMYFPRVDENQSKEGYIEASYGQEKVNINSATLKELDTLKGIGEIRARSIIDNRPYSEIEDLVTKKVLSRSLYDDIKDLIVVY